MAKKNKRLNKKQKKLIRRIMRENDPQRRVDEIVEQTIIEEQKKEEQLVMEILKKESQQARVDKWVEDAKKAMEIWNREVNPQLSVDKIVQEEIAKMAM